MMSSGRVSAVLLLLCSAVFSLPLYPQHVPGTIWKQRETERFIIIYPDTMSDEASNLAAALDKALEDTSSNLPVSHEHKKWPLVLTNLGVQANGFVTLAPRHSVWYATPGEDITAVSDWWLLLAHHEGRHMAQFDAADQGATRFLHGLFGELGWGAGIVMGTPSWLLEGDAVVMETHLSEEGRGRDPLFTMEVMALVSENPDTDYLHAVNQSFKNHIPDYYRIGYSLSLWIRKEYGEDALEEIYRSSARIPIPVIGLNTGTKRGADTKPKNIFLEMAANLSRNATLLRESGNWTQAEIITPEPETFTRYDALFDTGNGRLYARKETLSQAPALVEIDLNHNEKQILRLPREGRVSMAVDMVNPDVYLRIAWNSLRIHPVYTGKSVSDITIVDLDNRSRVIRRKTIIKGSRYLYPALNPDGSKLAVVELMENGSAALVILDTETGKELNRLDLSGPPLETAAYPSWSPDGKKIVFSLRNNSGRRITEWEIGTSMMKNLTDLTFLTVKTPVYSADGNTVYYSSNETGLEAVWAVTNNNQRYLAAQRWYGAYNPAEAHSTSGREALYIVEYASSQGEVISRVEISPPGGTSVTRELPEALPESVVPESAISVNTIPETDYKPYEHIFNFHSWGLNLTNNRNELQLSIRSEDVMGTAVFEIGALYEITESSPGAYADLSFTAIRPVIGIHGDYRYRSPKIDPFHQTSFSISALYPANLARTGIWNHNLDIGISSGLLSYYTAKGSTADSVSSVHYPFLTYLADWSRLRPGSKRAFHPDLGWSLIAAYSHIPLPDNYGESASAELKLYFPGGFRNTSLSLGAGIEHRTAIFTTRISKPRGYDWENPGLTMLGTIDYEIPLGYPDLPIGSVIFIQRFRLDIFSDFEFIGERRWSTGAVLTMDFAAFNNFPGLNIGIQFSWRWLDNTPRIEFMIMELPLF